MKRLQILLLIQSTILTPLQAQTFDQGYDTWNERTANEPYNVGCHSLNPVWLADNPVCDFGVARVGYTLGRGDFHAPDASGRTGNIDAYVGGLRRIGKIYLAGHIGYSNSSLSDMQWNSTLGIDSSNPFILGDSVCSDQTIEQFRMKAAAAYQISPQWTLGLSVGLTTGRLSDQTDPRPETSSSDIPVTAGAAWRPNAKMQIGLDAGIRFYRSDISHIIIDPLTNHVFFLMKGNGDYYRRSSADVGGYEREYKGNYRHVAAQVKYDFNSQWTDFLELSYERGSEKATDEGSTPFHGGDYKPTAIALSNRLKRTDGRGNLHNLIVAGHYLKGDATWYDQKKVVDTDHGNRYYYQVLSSYKIQENTSFDGMVEYRYERMRNARRDFFADLTLAADNFNRKHYGSQGSIQQKATVLKADVAAGKSFMIKDVNLEAVLRAGYSMPAGDDFGDASSYAGENIARTYSMPVFEYQTARQTRFGCTVNAFKPLSGNLTAGAYARVDTRLYGGDSNYSDRFESTSFTTAEVGLFLHF